MCLCQTVFFICRGRPCGAIVDWYSRYILSWEISNTLTTDFCVKALETALKLGHKPEIFNTDQGCQFTSNDFTKVLIDEEILISMDGKGRALDNVFVERFWRIIKYEYIYLHEFKDGKALFDGLLKFMQFYNFERKHQSLRYLTPNQVFNERLSIAKNSTKLNNTQYNLNN